MEQPQPTSRLVIDTRSLWRVLLTRTHHWITMAFAIGVFLYLISGEPFEGLTIAGQRTLAVFCVCVILWITQAIPLSVTGLLAVLLLPLCGVLSAPETFSLFGNKAVFFILGAFILAAAVMNSGLSTRVAMRLLNRFGTTPTRLIISVMILAALLAHIMPEHAVAAMLLPIAIEISRALKLERGRSRMGAGLFLALAWGSVIGGIATILGGTRAPLAIEILERTTGDSIGFLEWWVASAPLVVLSLAAGLGVILLFFKPEVESTQPALEALRARLRLMGRPTLEEWSVGVIFSLTVLGWVFSQVIGIDVALIALIGVVALFAVRVISWRVVEGHVNWGVILMYGGAIALGQAMSEAGTAVWLARGVLSDSILGNTWLTLLVLAALSLFMTECMSNAAVVALLLPIGLELAPQIGVNGVDPKLVVFAITLPAGLAFTLPISTPPNALAHSTGFVMMQHVATRGPILNFLCLVAFMIVAAVWWGGVFHLW